MSEEKKMSYLETVGEASAAGDVASIYERDTERVGYLPNYSRLFSLHPEAYLAWRGLIAAIARPMDERRYELATVAAAGRLRLRSAGAGVDPPAGSCPGGGRGPRGDP